MLSAAGETRLSRATQRPRSLRSQAVSVSLRDAVARPPYPPIVRDHGGAAGRTVLRGEAARLPPGPRGARSPREEGHSHYSCPSRLSSGPGKVKAAEG